MSYDEIAPDVVSPSAKDINQLEHLDTVIALYDFPGTQPSHLPLNLGDTVYVLLKNESGWWDGVMFGATGELLRGWFPSNYVRLVNYVQPVLNKLKLNKEIDSITAQNTAANVLIPSFTNLLQKNLLDSERNSPLGSVRKNSVVSFASSETSDTKGSTTAVNSNSGGYVALAEAERLSEEYKASTGRNVCWISRCTAGGDIVYYCEQLDVMCESVPLLLFDLLVDLPTTHVELPPRDVILDKTVVGDEGDVSLEDPVAPGPRPSVKLFDSLKRDSNALSMSLATLTSYHHFSQPFFSLNGLFYKHTTDLTYWTEVRERFEYLLELAVKALQAQNKQLFSTHFNRLTRIISVVAAAARLVQQDFVGTKYERLVRRKLKRIAGLYAQLYINGILHLSFMHYTLNTSDSQLFLGDIIRLNKSLSFPNSGSLSVLTIKPKDDVGKTLQLVSKNLDEFASYLQHIEHEVLILRTNMNSLVKIFLRLTKDKKVKQSDYNGLGTDDDDDDAGIERYNILPQVYPRFITDEFNGGNWCNPFFTTKNPVLNASGDDLKIKYHSKVIIDREAYDQIKGSTDEMVALSNQTLELLDPKVQEKYYNEELRNDRNTQILKLIYKYLHHALTTIDLIESFDFTVFCLIKRYENDEEQPEREEGLTFDYPVVLEFFQFKQHFHDLISNIVMSTQALTVQDPDVFKGMKEDDPLFYNKDVLKVPTEKAAMLLSNILLTQSTQSKGDLISLNPDTLMLTILVDGIRFFESILSIIQQLIEERETILNYATRVMHDDFNVQLLLIERNNTIHSEKTEDGTHSYYSGKKQLSNTPWYLEGDEEYDLLLDIKGNIKGGTKEALVAHLTHHDLFDSNFNTGFLLTFALMMTIGEFITLLILRFNIEAPEGLSYDEYNTWIARKQSPIRLRVMNIMKLLVEKHWLSSYYNEPVLRQWLKFAQLPTVQSISIGKVLSSQLQRLLNGEVIFREREPSIPNFKPPAPLTKGFTVKRMKLLDIDYIELARQLTLMEFRYYSKITKFACLSKVWGRKSGLTDLIEPITDFIRASNQLTNFVAYMILRKPDPKKRVQVIRYFVSVAEKCRQYNNFSSMTAIILALYSSPIHRLKKTWKYVSPDTLLHLQNMNKLMNSSRNFNEYRDMLKFVGSEPCVPFFGVYLSDLTFVFHGNPDYLMNRPRMLNFAKRAKTCEIVLGIDRFKSTGYNLQEVPEIQRYLEGWFEKCPTIEDQYQLSLQLEPRESAQQESSSHANNFRNAKLSLGSFSFK